MFQYTDIIIMNWIGNPLVLRSWIYNTMVLYIHAKIQVTALIISELWDFAWFPLDDLIYRKNDSKIKVSFMM
jgi:hypothetical protein